MTHPRTGLSLVVSKRFEFAAYPFVIFLYLFLLNTYLLRKGFLLFYVL